MFYSYTSRPHSIACSLVIMIAVGLMFSPPVANLAELLLVALMVGSGELRQRLVVAWRQPLFKATIAFWLVTAIGVIYSTASSSVALSMWGGWRKLLLLPVAMALFDNPVWKKRFVFALIGACVAAALASFTTWAMHISLIGAERGVLLRNHSTQGMLFAVATFSAMTLAMHSRSFALRVPLIGAAALLAGNIALVTPGRSGYLVLVVVIGYFALEELLKPRKDWKSVAITILMLTTITAGLALSPTARGRITKAIQEVSQYQNAQQETSMGIRVIFWKNALQLISERPLTGYGTGAFGEAYGQLVAGKLGLAGTPAGDPHNQYMKVAVEHGLPGLLVFLAMLAATLHQRPPTPWRQLGLGVLVAWCATSLANSHFSTFTEGTFIYLWLGVLLAQDGKPAAT